MAQTEYYYEEPKLAASLLVFTGMNFAGQYPVSRCCVIGRRSKNNTPDIPISSIIVSRSHGEISYVSGKYYYRDCGSTNGTYINGAIIGTKNVDGVQAVELKNGDILSFDLVENGKHHEQRVIAIFTTALPQSAKWQQVPLDENTAEILIGRSDTAGLKSRNNMFSEKHASFFLSKKGWAIVDHNSKNGVWLNNKKVSSAHKLHNYDVVRIVDTFFVFLEDKLIFCSNFFAANKESNTVDSPSLTINIVERTAKQGFKKVTLLQDIKMSIYSGEMVLILGGSGAGKTTFINAVMGYEKAKGKIVYNKTDIYEEYENMKYEIGFVPQQDLLRGSDTVFDTLSNAAEMKLPTSFSLDERLQRIDSVLEELGLRREKETLVSKLSGGQRKRLSIAVEFVSDPSLFFLDEPDSGLDDVMGRGLMENLRSIADKGKIIMVITHSPERAAELFDKVIVLAKSEIDNCGHLAFYGRPTEAFDFFNATSFSGIVKKVNRRDENGEGLSDYYIKKYSTYRQA